MASWLEGYCDPNQKEHIMSRIQPGLVVLMFPNVVAPLVCGSNRKNMVEDKRRAGILPVLGYN